MQATNLHLTFGLHVRFRSLGSLNHLHFWHDNSGAGASASWFVKYFIVRDLQTMEKFHFICQRWLAVEKDDGKVRALSSMLSRVANMIDSQIERLLPVASDSEKAQFSYLISKQTSHNLADEHLWYSVFSRPISNRFTRVQRCTCCFVLLFLAMFLNIVYYDRSKESEQTSNSTMSWTLGPVRISLQQVRSFTEPFLFCVHAIDTFRLSSVLLSNYWHCCRVYSSSKYFVGFGLIIHMYRHCDKHYLKYDQHQRSCSIRI
jgi:hypothetical protein